MLVEKDNLWYGLLTSRYGDLNYRILVNSGIDPSMVWNCEPHHLMRPQYCGCGRHHNNNTPQLRCEMKSHEISATKLHRHRTRLHRRHTRPHHHRTAPHHRRCIGPHHCCNKKSYSFLYNFVFVANIEVFRTAMAAIRIAATVLAASATPATATTAAI